MEPIPALSIPMLERLERRLRSVAAPALTHAQPGLPLESVRALTASFPGTVPAEAELWWSWRAWAPSGDILPSTKYVAVDEAVNHYRWRRRFALESATSALSPHMTADDWWHPLWLPIFAADGGMVVISDVAASEGISAPIRRIDWQSIGGRGFNLLLAPSLGRYISDLLDAIDAGLYAYEDDFWTECESANS